MEKTRTVTLDGNNDYSTSMDIIHNRLEGRQQEQDGTYCYDIRYIDL